MIPEIGDEWSTTGSLSILVISVACSHRGRRHRDEFIGQAGKQTGGQGRRHVPSSERCGAGS